MTSLPADAARPHHATAGRKLLSLSALAALLLATHCVTDLERATNERLVRREQAEALVDLDARIADDPKDPLLRYVRANVLLCSYEWDRPDPAKLHQAIADATLYLDAKLETETEDGRRRLEQAHEFRLDAYRLLGDVPGEVNELVSAYVDGVRSFGLGNETFYAAFALLCNERYVESIDWFTRYLGEHPYPDHTNYAARALRLRAETHFRSGNEADGLADLARVVLRRDTRQNSRDILLLGARLAQRLVVRGDLETASEVLGECVRVDPTAASHLRHAMVALRRGKAETAREDYFAADKIEPHTPLSSVVFGLLQFAEGRPERAFEALDGALENDPEFAEAYYERGRLILAAGGAACVDRAIADFERYAELRPDDLSVLELVALAHLAAGRWQKAIDALTPLVTADPNALEAHKLLAQAHYRLGNWQEAALALEVVVNARPDDEGARVARAEALVELERFMDAARLLESVATPKAQSIRLVSFAAADERALALAELEKLAHCTDVAVLATLSEAFEQLAARPNRAVAAELRSRVDVLHACAGLAANVAEACQARQWRDAIAALDIHLANAPQYGPFWLLRGGARLGIGDGEGALADADAGARVWDSPSLLRLRAQALEKLGRDEEATVAWEAAVARDATARRGLAEILLRLGRSADALAQYRELVMTSSSPADHQHRIKTYLELAKAHHSADDCCNAFSMWLRWNPADHEARFQYAYWLSRVEDWSGAVYHYDQCESLTRGDTAAKYAALFYFNRSICLWKLDRFWDAQRDQDEALRLDPKLPRYDLRDHERLAAEQAERERLEQQWRERDAAEAREQEEHERYMSQFVFEIDESDDQDWWDNQSAGAELDRRIRMIKAGVEPPHH